MNERWTHATPTLARLSRLARLGIAVGATVAFASPKAVAAEERLTLGEIAPPPAGAGIDAPAFKRVLQEELRLVPRARLPHRRIVVSALLRVPPVSESAASYGCTVSTMLRDGRSGTMLAVVEGRASSEHLSSPDARRAVVAAAARRAIEQIPDALDASLSYRDRGPLPPPL